MGVSLGGGGISLGGGGTGLGALPFAIRSTDSQPAIFTSTGARDTYYTTNPGDLVGELAAGREAVGIGPTDGDPVGVTAAFIRNDDNTGWIPIATNFVGATGPAGPTGPGGANQEQRTFESIAARSTFFGIAGNRTDLVTDTVVMVYTGNGRVTNFRWTGTDNPGTYDDDLWVETGVEITPGTIAIGRDGLKISSGNNVINMEAPNNNEYIIQGLQLHSTGTETPRFWDIGTLITSDYATVGDTNLIAPQSITLTSPALTTSTYVEGFIIEPHEAGTLRVEGWAGSVDTGPKILDLFITVAVGDINKPFNVALPNGVLLFSTENTLIRFSGVGLIGGLQTVGPFSGQTVPFLRANIRTANQVEYAYDGKQNLLLEAPFSGQGGVTIRDSLLSDKLTFEYNDAIGDSVITTDEDLIYNAVQHDMRTARADSTAVLRLAQTGSNGGATEVTVGNRNPTGNVIGAPGEVYIRTGVDADVYQHRGSVSNNTDWTSVFTGSVNTADVQAIVGAMFTTNVDTGITSTYNTGTQKIDLVVTTTPSTGTSDFFYGFSASNNPASVDTAGLSTQTINTGTGQQFTFSTGNATENDFLILLTPAIHDINTLVNTGTGFSVLNSFTKTDNVRTISTVSYDSYVLGPLVAGFNATYRATLL